MSKQSKSSQKPQEVEAVDDQQHDQEEPILQLEPDEVSIEEQLNIELLQAREEAKNNLDLYLRSMAEMDNLRKRTAREKEDLAKFANENILREILPVLDNLERAVEHAETAEENGSLLEGVQMTLTQFGQVLNRFGVVPINALGEPFDPALHQAMGQLETDEYPSNAVAQEMQKGYLLNDRLLRPAMVMVAKAAPPQPEKNDDAAASDSAASDQ